jgi:streptogramin lyase
MLPLETMGPSRPLRIHISIALFALAALSACSSIPFKLPPQAKTISGQVSGWSRGASQLRVIAPGSPSKVIASGTVTEAGEFTLTLPGTPPPGTWLAGGIFPKPVDCDAAQYTLTPAFNSGVIVTLDVFNTNKAKAGALLLASSREEPSAFPAPGDVQVEYFYASEATQVQGWCQNRQYDLNLNPGWNTIWTQGQSDGTAKVQNSDVPGQVAWFFQPHVSRVVLEDIPRRLQIGEKIQLKATAYDERNNVIPDAKFLWIPSNKAVVSVTSDGTVTGKSNGRCSFEVSSARMRTFTSELDVWGLEARGGTFNPGSAKLGTVFFVRNLGPTGQGQPLDQTVTINGPNGWNNGQPHAFTFAKGRDRHWFALENTAPVSGTYTASMDGQVSRFTLNAQRTLEPAKIQTVTPLSSDQVQAVWNLPNADANSAAVDAHLLDATDGKIMDTQEFQWGAASNGFWSIYPNRLNLAHQNKVQVTVLNSNTLSALPEQFNASRTEKAIDFTPVVSGLSFNGALSNGNVRLTIRGQFFTNNSSVKFGNVPSSAVSLDYETQLSAIVPSGSLGTVNVTVTTPAGSSATTDKTRFTYFAHSEYNVYTQARLLAGANGVMWFLGGEGSVVLGKIQNGTVSTYSLPNGWTPNEVSDFMIGADGQVWLVRNSLYAKSTDPSQFVKFNPVSNTFGAPFNSPGLYGNEFANQISMIVLGPDQNIWATLGKFNVILKLNPNDGSLIETYTMPFDGGISSQGDLVAGPGNTIWFNGFSNWYGQNKIARITTTGTITVFDTKLEGGYGICYGPDGNIWVSGDDHLLKLGADGTGTKYDNTYSGNVSEAYSASRRLVAGSDQHFWYGRSVLRRMNTTGQNISVSVFDVTPSTGSDDLINEVARDSNGKIWYSRGNFVGVLTP